MNGNATIRDLLSRMALSPMPADFDRECSGPPGLAPPARAKFGAALITANSGGGAYTITEARRSGGALAAMTAPAGFVDRVAYAVNGSEQWEVGDPVLYVQVPTDEAAGTFTTYIERGAGEIALDTSTDLCFTGNLRITSDGRIAAVEADNPSPPPDKIWYDTEGNPI